MLGIFAKAVLGQNVKTRLQALLSRQEAEHFHVACLADTLETAWHLQVPRTLFLHGAELPGAMQDLGRRLEECGLAAAKWESLQILPQCGGDLGERLENAFAGMLDSVAPRPCLIVGSDHPSLPAGAVRDGLERLATAVTPPAAVAGAAAAGSADLVLGPTRDGGYWCIGCVRPIPALLQRIAWSTAGVLRETQQRAAQRGLRIALLQPWTDVDRPEDLPVLAQQIEALRAQGDAHTARHTESFLRRRGLMRRRES